jgi:hypothetical protein
MFFGQLVLSSRAKFLRGLVAFAAMLAASFGSAHAVTFMDINFDADTLGAAPTTRYPVPGTPNQTDLWAIGGYAVVPGTILVNNAPGISKGVVLTTDSADGTLGSQWIDTAFAAVGQNVGLSFDINVLAAPTTATTQPKILDGGPGTAGILLGMNAFSTAGSFRFAVAPTSATGGVFSFRTPDNLGLVSFFNYNEGDKYHLDFDVDYTAGTLDAYVDGVLQLNDYSFLPGGASNVTTQEFFFHLNGEVGSANSVAIDNIFATVVPEPSTIAAAVIGLVGLTVASVRRRRVKAC